MAIAVKDIIPKLLNQKLDWEQRLMQQWPTIVGSLQTRIRLEKIYDATVVIGVYESHWMQELYLLSSVILDGINDFLGERRIEAVRFVLVEERPKTVRWMHRAKQFHAVQPDDRALTDLQKNALLDIRDEELKDALVQFLARTRQWGAGL